ncbi:aldo/keto reductase [Pseudarthrobacter sp. AL07]|uniref:aldo/keto reductase n=1 Tax=unclassified Pseudarthrobacter TaxID=2647000 RepID=UPI00249B954D|nr:MULTISPECIES: aldo/keto reductase [unclassified Pseudarthrobacter]MDI3193659.1 aldo/keto reductase [Pseudarthrobacter sp. AL20]MDI3207831.1 aldo/keto reductase [Pseudarthrobacter sp. AL07]
MQELIYGCMGLGGSWTDEPHGTEHVDQAAAAVEAALDAGITLFDHADIYRSGKSEAVFGEVLAATPGLRDRIRLQTKCGIRLNERGLATHYDLSRESILERVDGSLKRLQTDYVDVLLLHRPDPLTDLAEVAAAVGQLVADGRIRALGVSNMSGAQIDALQERLEAPVVANQLEMSLLKRAWLESQVLVNHPESVDYSFPHGTLEYCSSNGVTVQAYGALAQGLYTGAAPENPTAAETAAAAMVAELAGQYGTTGEAVLLGWLMKHPAGIAPVIGTVNPARIAACADAARVAEAMTRAHWYGLWVAARGSTLP